MRTDLNIPHKASRILNLVLLAFLLIFARVWYLTCIQGDYHRQKAKKPQRRSWIEKVDRATIRDRFNIPLAQNTLDYAVAIRYADIREIPPYKWVVDNNGKKVKQPIRALYITSLSQFLGKELEMDPEDIEDIIYAKASLFPQTLYKIKDSLNEKQYYRLRSLEKDWQGLQVQKTTKRVYPQGKIGCDVIGYMGSINTDEYIKIAEEIRELEEYVKKRESGEIVFLPRGYKNPIEVRNRLTLLKEKAYTLDDRVGKTGIEKTFDETLRGIHGKKIVEVDPKGNVMRELPCSKKGTSGQRVCLTISSELQAFAEELLAQSEKTRDSQDSSVPWIKGGAAVAFDPKTGEILALASYPRFDPNDFVLKNRSVHKWMETETHIGDIWNGKVSLTRDMYKLGKGWTEEVQPLNWDFFLSKIVPQKSAVATALRNIHTMHNAYLLHKHFSILLQQVDLQDPIGLIEALYANQPHIPSSRYKGPDQVHFLQDKLSTLKGSCAESFHILHSFLASIPYNDDKLLVLDLTRLLLVEKAWTPAVLEKMGHLSLSSFFALSQSFYALEEAVREKTKSLHHTIGFKTWKSAYFKRFLQQKRKEEKAQKKHAKPYTDYLEKIERTLFASFWPTCKYLFIDAAVHGEQRIPLTDYPELLPYVAVLQQPLEEDLLFHAAALRKTLEGLSPLESVEFLKTLRHFEELDRPLYGRYNPLRHLKGVQLEKHLASAFYPISGFGYGRSQAFRQATPLGSVFKLVVAYEALKERYEHLKENDLHLEDLNPLTLTDLLQGEPKKDKAKQILGYTTEGQAIRRYYKGGLMPRSSHPGIGKVDIIQAIEQSSNIYFSILAAEHIADPTKLEEASKSFGFGKKTGIALNGEIAGNLPNDLSDNKSGLYAFAIGQHSLIGTPLQAVIMLSALGNQGKILKPQIVRLTAGKYRKETPFPGEALPSYPFQEPLSLIGVDFPLFTESLMASYDPQVQETDAEEVRSIFFPDEIKEILLDGMNKVVSGKQGTARPWIIQELRNNPKDMKDYVSLQGQLVGKTGTAEILYKGFLTAESKPTIHNHIWFGGLVFPEGKSPTNSEAELAVMVYLKFSEAGGKVAAPIAAKIIKKWRQLQKEHQD